MPSPLNMPLSPRDRPLTPRQGAFRPSHAHILGAAGVDESPE